MSDLGYEEGDHISFLRVTRHRDYSYYPCNTSYTGDRISGTVLKIRDLNEDKLCRKTVSSKPEIERSRYLITVKTKKGLVKCYHGVMLDITVTTNEDKDVMKALKSIV